MEACKAWSLLVPLLQQAGQVGACATLISWLRICLTLMPIQGNALLANTLIGLVGVAADEDLGGQHETDMNHDLSSHHQPFSINAAQLAQAVSRGNQETQAYHLAQAEDKNQDKLPSQRWASAIDVLMWALNIK